MKKIIKLFSLMVFFPLLSRADQAPEWTLIPEKSFLEFEAVSGGSPVKGKFDRFSCDVRFDHENLKGSKVKCSFDLTSVNTSYKDRDDLLKNSQWFKVSEFPEASFESSEFDKTEDGKFKVSGVLKIKGIEHKISFPFDLVILRDKQNKETATVEAATSLKRLVFNIGEGEWADISKIADDVKVVITLRAER